MMDSSEYLELSLAEIRQGDIRFKDVLTVFFQNSLLFIPIRQKTDFAESSKILPARFLDGDREVIPVFTSQERLEEWSTEFQSILVYGSDLVMMIDSELSLSLDPTEEMNSGFQFLPTDISRMQSESEIDLHLAEDDFRELVGNSGLGRGLKGLTTRLADILAGFPEVKESFLEEVRRIDPKDGPISEAILGILSQEMVSDRRFRLISQIASLSKDVFGDSGAILVYDDLAKSKSKSWELFNTKTPFYVNDNSDLPPEIVSTSEVDRYEGPVYVTVESDQPSPKEHLFSRKNTVKLGASVISKLRRIRRDIINPGW